MQDNILPLIMIKRKYKGRLKSKSTIKLKLSKLLLDLISNLRTLIILFFATVFDMLQKNIILFNPKSVL